jgi:hypothetical protein
LIPFLGKLKLVKIKKTKVIVYEKKFFYGFLPFMLRPFHALPNHNGCQAPIFHLLVTLPLRLPLF